MPANEVVRLSSVYVHSRARVGCALAIHVFRIKCGHVCVCVCLCVAGLAFPFYWYFAVLFALNRNLAKNISRRVCVCVSVFVNNALNRANGRPPVHPKEVSFKEACRERLHAVVDAGRENSICDGIDESNKIVNNRN